MTHWIETVVLACEPLEQPGGWWIELAGALDGGPTLAAFEAQVDALIEGGARAIVFEVSQVRSFCDLGFGVLVALQDRLARAGGGVVLVGLSDRNRVALELIGIAERFAHAGSREEGVRECDSMGR